MGVNYSLIGQRIQKRRKQMNRTQENLAEYLGVSVGYISQIERGVTKISLDTLSKVSLFLECSISTLLGQTETCGKAYLEQELSEIWETLNKPQKELAMEIISAVKKYGDE